MPLGSNRPWSNAALIVFSSSLFLWWLLPILLQRQNLSLALIKSIPAICALVLIQLIALIQLLAGWSENPSETLNHLLLGLSFTFLFIITLDTFNSRKAINLLLGTLIVSGTFQAFYGSTMVLSQLEWGFFETKETMQRLATGTFINRNHLAGYLELTAACGIGLLLALRDHKAFSLRSILQWLSSPKALIRVSLIIMVIGLVMTRSRMGNIAFVSSLIITGAILAAAIPKLQLRLTIILASLLIIDVLIVAQYFGLDELQQRLVNTQIDDKIVEGQLVAKQNIIRDEVLAYTAPLVKQYALTGSGAGTFEVIFPAVAGPDITSHFDHAHNDYVQLAIEYGIVGLCAFAFFFIFCFYHGVKALCLNNSTYRSGIGFACVMGLTAIAIHSISDFNLQIPANAATVTVLSALGLVARFNASATKRLNF